MKYFMHSLSPPAESQTEKKIYIENGMKKYIHLIIWKT